MNIFVAKLSGSTTNEDLFSLFSQYGEVTSAKVIIDRETGNSKRFGFVEMTNDDEANTAIEELNETSFQDSTIVVKVANAKKEFKKNPKFGGKRRY